MLPRIKSAHSFGFIFTFFFLESRFNIRGANVAMIIAQMTGVMTGPIHGIGIRNRMSHVNIDDGQFRIIFNQI